MGDIVDSYKAMIYAILIGVALAVEQLVQWASRKRRKKHGTDA